MTKAFAIAEAVRNGENDWGLDPRQPYAHFDTRYDGKLVDGRWETELKVYRTAVTCGVHCMVMQVQLHASDIASELTKELENPKTGKTVKKIQAVSKKDLRVGQRCVVCDSVVRSR